MLITFKSSAGGDVIMFGDVAIDLLGVMGKHGQKEGVVTIDQIPDAIARLRQASAASKAKPAPNDDHPAKPLRERQPVVSLAQRAAPLIELLEYSQKAKVPVTWTND